MLCSGPGPELMPGCQTECQKRRQIEYQTICQKVCQNRTPDRMSVYINAIIYISRWCVTNFARIVCQGGDHSKKAIWCSLTDWHVCGVARICHTSLRVRKSIVNILHRTVLGTNVEATRVFQTCQGWPTCPTRPSGSVVWCSPGQLLQSAATPPSRR